MVNDVRRLFAVVGFAGIWLTSACHRWQAALKAKTIERSSKSTPMIIGRLLVTIPLFGGGVRHSIHPSWMRQAVFDLPYLIRWTGTAGGLSVTPLAHWIITIPDRTVSPTVLN